MVDNNKTVHEELTNTKDPRDAEIMTAAKNIAEMVLESRKWIDYTDKALKSIERGNFSDASESLKVAAKNLNYNSKLLKQAAALTDLV